MWNGCERKGKKIEGTKALNGDKNGRESKSGTRKSKGPQPLFNIMGSISGVHDQGGPVTKMRMYYTKEGKKKPELNIDIDLAKDQGSDEKFCLSSEPTEGELEERQHKRLKFIECELEDLKNKLEAARQLRKDWNAQKEGLCNRKLKDSPTQSTPRPC